MVSYQQLLDVDLEPLSEAVTKWGNLPGQFRQIGVNFYNQVEAPLINSDWEGETADAAREKIRKVSTQFDEATGEADDVHNLLQSAHKKFKGLQDKLKGYKKSVDADKNLDIDGTGRVSYKPTNLDELSPQAQGMQAKNYSQVTMDYNRYITEVLDQATKADELLDWALRLDPNGRSKGFTDEGLNSMNAAKAGRELAVKDAQELTKLASIDYRELTPEELKRTNTLLAKHSGDPFFAEKFATDMGAKNTLAFWQRVADERQTGDAKTKTTADLQKNLSLTLATASHSDSAAMEKWKHDAIKLGTQRFEDTNFDVGGRPAKGPYGFQIMSSLMRYGEYDKDFLTQYGKGYGEGKNHVPGLIEFDKKASKNGSLDDFWRGGDDDRYQAMLNLGPGGDNGLDPMAGYMEALGRNPEAAQDLFYQKGFENSHDVKPDPDLQYLLKDREWVNDSIAGDKKAYGYGELGHALEAATLGHPYDQPELGLHKSPESANVMTQAVSMVADNSGLVDAKPGISDSMARMGAGYIDNLNWATANHGDASLGGEDTRNAAFGSLGDSDIKVGNETAKNFLSAVGRDEGSYGILSAAQQEFTTSAIKAHPEPDRVLTTVFGTGAETHGILDEARSDAIMSDADDSKEEKARKLSESGEWQKYTKSTAVNTGASLIQAPFEAARAAPFIAPVIDAGTGALETESGIMIDREIERQQKAFDTKVDSDAHDMQKDFVEKSQRRSVIPLEAYLAAHPEANDTDWYSETNEEIRNGYNRGANDSRLTGSGN
ncbi:hypothetical protein DVA86_24865 [Streptomyces armeniacus]|uniref:Uncharacterized protein n=1 Tax=Streptomyces armeniacus TaxID=83291 RepID=A0A345XUT2_9ACTN|nr:hypothetical protein [Streptomyces armeniacus]AXK35398.1 hypothetical protein DVA86_24865 [Streptomyces armeniacus]